MIPPPRIHSILPVIDAFMAAHRLPDVTVAGMISRANQKAIEAAGLSFILGMRIPDVPYMVDKRRQRAPGPDPDRPKGRRTSGRPPRLGRDRQAENNKKNTRRQIG